jgi:putative PIN family toxin of toxin-antitoxin system
MRVVVDTNVFISAAIKDAAWPALIVRWPGQFDGLLKTPATEQEVFEVLRRPRLAEKVAPLFADRMRRIFASAELVTITEAVAACRDPKDARFLELAVNGHAGFIVSGDDDLLVMDVFRGIPVIAPAVFGRAQVLR